jgi:protocatechuate 3,4-dioxygenase beta subunit/kynurenine formamidase
MIPRVTILVLIVAFAVSLSVPAAVQKKSHTMQSVAKRIGTPAAPTDRASSAALQLQQYQAERAATQRTPQKTEGISFGKHIQTTSTVYFMDDMESGVNGWTIDSGDESALWHQTTSASNSPTHSWWLGSEATGTYQTGDTVDQSLISPSIDLTGASDTVTLLFTEQYVTEAGWDFCMVDVSSDAGTTWTNLRGTYGNSVSGNSHGWKVSTLNLSAYTGTHINIRFRFDTGDSIHNNFPGWYIDNVLVFDRSEKVKGKTFFDVNNNGARDSGDVSLHGIPVTASGGGLAVTINSNSTGDYSIPLPLGTDSIYAAVAGGWTETDPAGGGYTVALNGSANAITGEDFGFWHPASFATGTVFSDVDSVGIHDVNDTNLTGWPVDIFDSLYNQVDVQYTNSLGAYRFVVTNPGTYYVQQEHVDGWRETYPDTGYYALTFANLTTTDSGLAFGDEYKTVPTDGAIYGVVFNDLNRNGVYDAREPGVAGVTVQLNGGDQTTLTDSAGNYSFTNLSPGTYHVKKPATIGWWQSLPATKYDVVLDSGTVDSNENFGVYQITPGAIGGFVYDDANASGAQDSGEAGLAGWQVTITGTSTYGTRIDSSETTGPSGSYAFDSLWPGTYRLSQTWQSLWRQTQPANLLPYNLSLGVEQDLPLTSFGNTPDSSFSVGYRTFLPESLALAVDRNHKQGPVTSVPYEAAFQFTFAYDVTTSGGKGIDVKFSLPVLHSLVVTPATSGITYSSKDEEAVITFTSALTSGVDTVTISGTAAEAKDMGTKLEKVSGAKWDLISGKTHKAAVTTSSCVLHDLMPNGIDMLAAGPGNHLKVGLGGPHSVVCKTYKDVDASLLDKHGMHTGEPRCLSIYANNGKPISKQLASLTPTQGNNKLFAEALALKANIAASDEGITPGGFGDLIFNSGEAFDSTINGKTVRFIADSVLDKFMSSSKGAPGGEVCLMPSGFESLAPAESGDSIFAVVRAIDSAFSGPIDTIQFGKGIVLTAVRPLTAISYLHVDSSFATLATRPTEHQQLNASKPLVFSLAQNYPNPFNPSTMISFTLPQQAIVTLKIYNILGQEVTTLLSKEQMNGGTQQVRFNASNYASSVYFYRLDAETIAGSNGAPAQHYSSYRKMVLVK